MSISRSLKHRWSVVAALLAILMAFVFAQVYAANTIVTPALPDGWGPTDVRADGSVAITGTKPRSGTGSLEFETNTLVMASGLDKADFTKTWLPVGTRTLGSITKVAHEYYRDSSSTTGVDLSPAVRLFFLNDHAPLGSYGVEDDSGYLIWEGAYNGITPAPTNSWQAVDTTADNFWMRLVTGPNTIGGCNKTIQNYAVTLSDWATTVPVGQPGDCVAPTLSAATYITGINTGVGSGWNFAFLGFVDNIELLFTADSVTANFELAPQCTTTCYADAVGGNDADDGITPATAKKTIQAAIDQVSAGGTVRVLPGSYDETASGRTLFDSSGPYQFGLFIEDDAKDGISILGVTALDVVITDPTATEADIKTNATNNFGASGIFVEADDVTIGGLEIGPNAGGDNKTIEIIGDGFSLKDSFLNVLGGGFVYFNDWRFDTILDTSYVQSYNVDNNVFVNGGQVAVSSGAGYSGPVAGRTITDNEFNMTTGQNWPSISFNGDTTTVPWFVYPVSGAVITGNTFTNLNMVDGIHIRTRGVADDSTFDWDSYWNDNTYNKAVVVGVNPPTDVRSWSYTTSYTFNDVRMIGAVIQPGINIAVAGDTVLVKAGTYPESPDVDESVTLLGEDGRDVTFIQLQTGTNYTHSLLITGAIVTVDGFTIIGIDANCPTDLAATNIYLNTAPDTVVIQNNRLRVGLPGGCTTFDDGFGLITEYSGNPDVASLTVNDNIFEPLTAAGGQRAYYINPSVVNFVFRDNSILGNFLGTAASEAQNSLIEDNIITGTGTSGGLVMAGYVDPNVWGHGTIQRNTITGTNNAISIVDTTNVIVTKNILNANVTGVRVLVVEGDPFDQSTIHINRNAITNNTTIGVNNQLSQVTWGDIDAMCNWWGSPTGPGPVGPGTGDKVSADADFSDWLYTSNLDGPCGEPPVSNVCPVEGAGYLVTDALGIGQGDATKGFRTRKLVVPNFADLDSLYGQLAAVDVGLMKYVRFLPQGFPKVQIAAPTSPAYKPYAVDWWGSDLPLAKSVKGQFFWGAKGNKAPRAFILWPTYTTDDRYANVFEHFDDSSTYDVYWDSANGWIPIQTQTLDLPETQGFGATVNVTLAIVDNNKDNRPVIVTVEVGSDSEVRVITVPNKGLTLNLEDFTFIGVDSGVDEVTITLESPPIGGAYPFGGDSAGMIGAAANYECVDLSEG